MRIYINEGIKEDGEEIEEGWYEIKKETRTTQQNRALHLLFMWIAKYLNDSGQYVNLFFKKGVDIPWSPLIVKELFWKKVQEKTIDKKSTTELYKDEVTRVYEIINLILSEKGVHIPFPSKEFFKTFNNDKYDKKI